MAENKEREAKELSLAALICRIPMSHWKIKYGGDSLAICVGPEEYEVKFGTRSGIIELLRRYRNCYKELVDFNNLTSCVAMLMGGEAESTVNMREKMATDLQGIMNKLCALVTNVTPLETKTESLTEECELFAPSDNPKFKSKDEFYGSQICRIMRPIHLKLHNYSKDHFALWPQLEKIYREMFTRKQPLEPAMLTKFGPVGWDYTVAWNQSFA